MPSPATDQNGQPAVNFHLTSEGGQRFYNFTSAHVEDSLGVVLDNKVQEVATIKEPIRDQGQINGGHMNEQAGQRSFHDSAFGRSAGQHQVSRRANGRARRWAQIPFAPACGRP